MAQELFGRAFALTVGDVDISDLACEFSVKKTIKREPNTCELRIYNLAPDTRKKLTAPKKIVVRLEAGYGKKLSQLYLGEVRALSPGEVRGADIITELSSGDSEKEIQRSHLAVPIGPKAATGDVLRAIARELGVGLGNVSAVASKLDSKGVALFGRATVITGNTARALDDFCRSAGLEWSIQDGALQLLDIGKALDSKPYVLSASSGLINAPRLDSEGKVSAQTLMLPDLRPGMRVEFDSLSVTGLYRVIQCEYVGQTHGQDWSIRIVCDKPRT